MVGPWGEQVPLQKNPLGFTGMAKMDNISLHNKTESDMGYPSNLGAIRPLDGLFPFEDGC